MAVACSKGVTGASHADSRLPRDADELLEFSGLARVANDMCGALPAGLLRKVGVVLVLAIAPRVVLLDEPAAGLNSRETAGLRRAADTDSVTPV